MNADWSKKLKDRHILVAGEVGLDEYVWGDTKRISPEAPVPVIVVDNTETKLGLTANVAQNISSLGAKTTLVSLKGNDEQSEQLSQLLTDAGIGHQQLITDSSRPTPRKVRVIARKQHVVRVDYEKADPINTDVAKKFRETICDLIPSVDGIVVQDYGKGLWNPDVMGFVEQARAHKCPIFVDPSRLSPPQLYRGATLLTPNLEEAKIMASTNGKFWNFSADDTQELNKLAQKLLEYSEAENMVITCGSKGMVSLTKGENKLQHIPTFAREVFDVTGAGDTVVAVLALAFTSGFSLSECMKLANAAAGLVVAHIGTACITTEQLNTELERLKSTSQI